MFRTKVAVAVALVLLVVGGIWASAQERGSRDLVAPTVIAGNDLGFRVESTPGNIVVGKLVASTGLTGSFDFEVHWTPDSVQQSTADAPSLFTALQEQLGLKLEAARCPADMLVIDHVELPTPD